MNDDKIWLIEAGDVLEVMTPEKKRRETVHVENIPPAPPRPRPAVKAQAPRIQPLTAAAGPIETPKRRKKPAAPVRSKLHFAPLVALTYLLGPLAILLTPRGRRQKFCVALAALAVGATAVLATLGFGGIVSEARPVSAWIWLGLLAVAVGAGFTAWARALHLIGAEGIPSTAKLPWWLRRSWAVTGLGLLAPGSGLLLGGKSGRAALTLWLGAPTVAGAVVLLHGLDLWRHHQDAGWLAGADVGLERALVVAAAAVAVGFLGYVAQALEGMRQVTVEPGLKARVKGDYYAVAVLAFALVLVVASNPARMAGQIDTAGDILRDEGFREIPLVSSLVSSHLDPARVEYSLQAMDLYTELGRPERAAALREALDADLGAYVALVQREAVSEFSLARAKTDPRHPPRAARAATPRATEAGGAAPDNPAVAAQKPAAPATGPALQQSEAMPVDVNAAYFLGALYGSRGSAADTSTPGR